MYKALIYKEWLKIRWVFLISAGVFLIFLIRIALGLSYNMRLSEPTSVWYDIIFRHVQFYDPLLYLPILSGLLIGIAQFLPEISENRLKLTLHLPLKPNRVLLFMNLIGISSLLTIFMTSFIGLALITLYFFPQEILHTAIWTSLPWFVAGLVCYLAVTMIFVETRWIKRFLLVIITIGFMDMFLIRTYYSAYSQSIGYFFLISLTLSISILLSGHRFRKGVR